MQLQLAEKVTLNFTPSSIYKDWSTNERKSREQGHKVFEKGVTC